MKYIVLEEHGAILFAGNLTHAQVAYDLNDIAYGEGNQIIAGGDVEIVSSKNWDNGFSVKCSGRAIGLKDIKSRGVEDELIISKMFDPK